MIKSEITHSQVVQKKRWHSFESISMIILFMIAHSHWYLDTYRMKSYSIVLKIKARAFRDVFRIGKGLTVLLTSN